MQYIHNYLKNIESNRSNLFIRIIRQLIVSKFAMDDFENEAQPLVDKLLNTEITIADIETEPIPFPHLLQLITKPVKINYSI